MFAAKEQNFKICNFSTRSLSVTLSQPIIIPNNFHFIESIPLLYIEILISETAGINKIREHHAPPPLLSL
jgi:hypothetical protein